VFLLLEYCYLEQVAATIRTDSTVSRCDAAEPVLPVEPLVLEEPDVDEDPVPDVVPAPEALESRRPVTSTW